MKKITLFFFSITAALFSFGQNTGITTASGSAVTVSQATDSKAITPNEDLLILRESEFDFGKIPQGKPVTHVFDVMNKSKDILNISNVVASCGCTTPVWDKDKPLDPGKWTQITAGYNAAAEGPFTKQITITYNDGQSKMITIKGEVWKTPSASAPENKNLNDLKN